MLLFGRAGRDPTYINNVICIKLFLFYHPIELI
ncbi:hypothetical protein COCCU_12560 [Corynebacterium occultum]|uniref:Uncharacterized protein n=1 Tax=Corynebacterium occultum TaxID=2675219 RepID=A0A6B8VS58_9CORY|nr:hypothetical protein COCCU_12560 [Corynebacterium occultum]